MSIESKPVVARAYLYVAVICSMVRSNLYLYNRMGSFWSSFMLHSSLLFNLS
jgi:hypothetical protein